MQASRLIILFSTALALSACADELRLSDAPDSGVTCGKVHRASEPWRAGCATRHNMALLADEPDDLILPRPETKGSLTPRGFLDGYRQSPRPGFRPARSQTAAAPAEPDIAGGTE